MVRNASELLLPSDPAYQSVKRLKQGTSRLDSIYDGFVAAFDEQFGFPLLGVGVDTMERPKRAAITPRLGVVLERSSQCMSFNAAPEEFANYDPIKQRLVAELFVDSTPGIDLRRLFGMPRRTPRTYSWRDEIFVYFSNFERAAIWEVHDLVPRSELGEWVSSLGLNEEFWCTERFVGPPIVFVYTEAQAAALSASELPNRWADSYFALAKKYDEFDYLARDEFFIAVDSKENFDANYESNWYYYFK